MDVFGKTAWKLVRNECKILVIELIEMGVERSTQIPETFISLTIRGADALWIIRQTNLPHAVFF